MKTSSTKSHVPDLTKMPGSLRGCPWLPVQAAKEWYDGQEILAAVPICLNSSKPELGWKYEFDVVTIECDDDYFACRVNGETWEWELLDADWFLPIYI